MSSTKRIERRKFERVRPPPATITLSSGGKYGNMIELSQGGFSADYTKRYKLSSGMELSGGILINLSDGVFYVSDLPFKIVWVVQKHDSFCDSLAMQRVGVQFNELPPCQKIQVQHLVHSCKEAMT